MSEKEKTVFEGEREIPVYTECDLLVVGGGAAGHSAAVAAAGKRPESDVPAAQHSAHIHPPFSPGHINPL